MAEVVPVPAASVMLLRDDPLEVLMILRHSKMSFAPDAWAFPGGAADEGETMHDAATRELLEETGIDLREGELVWTSHWITPAGLPKRFDTYFFLACTGRDTPIKLQESEAVDSTWISPADAVQRHMAGEFPLVFPTLKNLEAIVGFKNSSELMDARRNAEILPTRPIIIEENGKKKIVLP